MTDYERIAAEFGLGRPLDVRPLAGGRAEVARLVTPQGAFVVKPEYTIDDLVVAERVAAAATMRHLAAYHCVLAELPVPAEIAAADSIW